MFALIPAGPWTLLFALLIGHAVADYALQSEFMSQAKCRDFWHRQKNAAGTEWAFVLAAHALIHAGTVWLVTTRADLALAEFFFHAVIDHLKCRGMFSFAIDQMLHVLCKLGYLGAMFLIP